MDHLMFRQLGPVMKSFPALGTRVFSLSLLGYSFVKGSQTFHKLDRSAPPLYGLPALKPLQIISFLAGLWFHGFRGFLWEDLL